MRFISSIILVGFSLAVQAQSSDLKTYSLYGGKVTLSVPSVLKTMSDQQFKTKYPTAMKPDLALSDTNTDVNILAVRHDEQPLDQDLVGVYKDFEIDTFKKKRADVTIHSDGIWTISGKKIGYIKFSSAYMDQRFFNEMVFTDQDGKLLVITFNCISSLREKWEPIADKIFGGISFK